ncbi:class I SAM-dependent methyltransferase [Paenilisteria rocourtiae]|uniref:Methyltransferase family protein n=1 Tax=Listeria rocourtiae TaxID=647910 RepID=A0A4R6ZE47_9LIST|nr:class I SAM-dependent methyltransferase [Listeria rocourtiae]MBC1435139.1 class I SAM-dependent methyltransferase [Listeria rocourtiae]MBC1606076.1 class I SAM-dependent methyltransferase [Listeria rocourtiae]TDR50383.1 methyltransferase family protein [Listeria rocourtiae]
MKENKYDNPAFFEQYSKMNRSVEGLKGAGEWHAFKKMMPDFTGKRVLDLGCGFGWHCLYAVENGAERAVGVDISENMLAEARKKTDSPKISYIQQALEDIDFPDASFDVVISSLTFHYIESFTDMCHKINRSLTKGGAFVFSVEHPVFTAQGTQDWYYDEDGNKLHWPVDSYFTEGLRTANFLGEDVTKYHKTITTYVNTLLETGFELVSLVEPEPDATMLASHPDMPDELRRPMMLLVSARKK